MNIFARASSPTYDLDAETKENFIMELEALPDYIRCSVIHDFGSTAKDPKSVPIEIAETLVLIAGDVCNLAELPEVYTVDDEA